MIVFGFWAVFIFTAQLMQRNYPCHWVDKLEKNLIQFKTHDLRNVTII